jgi:hypothetical protein
MVLEIGPTPSLDDGQEGYTSNKESILETRMVYWQQSRHTGNNDKLTTSRAYWQQE